MFWGEEKKGGTRAWEKMQAVVVLLSMRGEGSKEQIPFIQVRCISQLKISTLFAKWNKSGITDADLGVILKN